MKGEISLQISQKKKLAINQGSPKITIFEIAMKQKGLIINSRSISY